MDKSYIMQTAETTRLQLLATTPANTLLSWGVEKFFGTVYNNMPALAIRVNGRLFTGNVVIAYNEGAASIRFTCLIAAVPSALPMVATATSWATS